MGDITRNTFDPKKHYKSVLEQQGRVHLDADWNEQVEIHAHRNETEALDVIGACGAPLNAPGFKITILPGAFLVAQGAWKSMTGHTLIPLSGGKILDWLESDGSWRLWNYDPKKPTEILQGEPVADGKWKTPMTGHTLIPLSGEKILDWLESDGSWRLWNYDPKKPTEILQGEPIADGQWKTPMIGHTLIPLSGGKILDWVKSNGSWQLWNYDPNNPKNILQGKPVAEDKWKTPMTGHTLIPLSGEKILDWAESDGSWRLWKWDYNPKSNILFSVVAKGQWESMAGHTLIPMSDGKILDWVESDGSWRLWTYDPATCNLLIGKGRYYVDGILCENENDVLLTQQPDLWKIQFPTFSIPGSSYLVYLDVWERPITMLEDDSIREKALGGPDTATRVKTVWQVKLIGPGTYNCATELFPSNVDPGKLSARAQPVPNDQAECEIPPGAGYRRLENQLYRVEIHDSGNETSATFKWSRENGSIARRWEKMGDNANELIVTTTKPDEASGIQADQWIELLDDTKELQGIAGTLVQVKTAMGKVLTVKPPADPNAIVFSSSLVNPKVRQWDTISSNGVRKVNDSDTTDDFIKLEDGVEIKFEPGQYNTGDYWLIPARTIEPYIEWPESSPGNPIPQGKRGIHHHYCKLGLLEYNGTNITITDCRSLFPPLTDLTCLYYVSGDGQQGPPGKELPYPLIVGVSNGDHPVEDAQVRYSLIDKNGQVLPGGTIVVTNPEGLAKYLWTLGQAEHQQIIAELIDSAGTRVHLPVIFNAFAGLCLYYVSGDGQEGQPGQKLKPLIVCVSSADTPLANIAVSFKIVGDSGALSISPGAALSELTLQTDSNGLATVDWTLNKDTTIYRQQVTATLVSAPNLQVIFNANLSIASEVAYIPADPGCFNPPVGTVQAALDQLCAYESGVRIMGMQWGNGTTPFNNTPVTFATFLSGLLITTDHQIDASSVSRATCYMTLEIPITDDKNAWYVPFTIRADVSASGTIVSWIPNPNSLPASIDMFMSQRPETERAEGYLARFTLKGNFIRDISGTLYLNGDDYGMQKSASYNLLELDDTTKVISGNKLVGGDFYMWFWVHPDNAPEKIGFMVRTGDFAKPIFGSSFESSIEEYIKALNLAIERNAVASAIGSGYSPFSGDYDIEKARQIWKEISQQNSEFTGTLIKRDVLVMAPEYLTPAAKLLCAMWEQINPDLKYIPEIFDDGGFVKHLANVLDNSGVIGIKLITLSSESTAREIQEQYPDDFGKSQFNPI